MAIVDKITAENIERFRGVIDFYMYKCILPVARKWPSKPKPPYTALQAEGMAVFSLANLSLHRIYPHMLLEWQKVTTGTRPSWTDIFRSIIMKYWKKYRTIAPIALDFSITETITDYKITWTVLQLYLDPDIAETIEVLSNITILKSDLANMIKPVYFTLYDDLGNRAVAPYILLEA